VGRLADRIRIGPISGFRLRTKLLLLALTTLALPWAGCQYAREMETVLRESEQQSLLAVTTTIAGSLKGRQELLFREDSLPAVGDVNSLDITPVVLSGAPLIDGTAEEWDTDNRNLLRVKGPGGDSLRLLAATHERWLYLALLVRDDRIVFDASDLTPLDTAGMGDRVWLAFDDKRGGQQQIFFSGSGPGRLRARRIETREYGREEAVEESRITAALQRNRDGYVLEVGVPLSLVGQRFGVLIDDRDRRGATRNSYGTLDVSDLRAVGRLIAASPDLSDHLRQFSQPGVELTVASSIGAVLTRIDAPALPSDYTRLRGFLPRMYRLLLDGDIIPRRVSQAEKEKSAEQLTQRVAQSGKPETDFFAGRYENSVIVAAAAPIFSADGKQVIGVIQLAQTADRWLTLRDRALTRLLNLTLFVTLFVVVAAFWFAGRMTLRISRLGAAAETALGREGNLSRVLPESEARDELGDLSRSFSSLLGRLDEYTGYLRTLAGKLAHEIRTPNTIIRSSLENLESEAQGSGGMGDQAKVYIARAREGSERLGAILTAMGAATRVEEAISHSEQQAFDLASLVKEAAGAYGTGFPQRRFICEVPERVDFVGAPELIVQMLDKLVDNAVDFSADGATITIVLRAEPMYAELSVANPGPPLPPEAATRLFESLWQSRSESDKKPHFGLGLYIVRLIAEFHGGSATAANLPEDAGAIFTVRLPLRPPRA
jgi:two-component system sensor histidine kinase ChvG